MFITVNNTYKQPLDIMRRQVKIIGKRAILFYKQGVTEVQLDHYLIQHNKLSLKLTCIYLLNQATIDTNATEDELIISFKNPELDKLARFITYGNGPIQGSKILIQAFDRKYK